MHPVTPALLAIAVFLRALPAFSQDTALLTHYNPASGYFSFRNPGIGMQAARFPVPAPGYVTRITIGLGGNSADGSARLRLFGHEGGIPAPVFEQDLIEPILLQKTKVGFESIEVVLRTPVLLDGNQFFVAVDEVDSGVVWLSDRIENVPFCSVGDDLFYNQLLKQRDGGWRWEKYAFVADVVMEFPELTPSLPLEGVAAGLGIVDSTRFNRSIAWGDVDRNGYLDLLVDGRLYLNREAERFDDVTEEFGLTGSPAANLFLDADNDGKLDILFVGSRDTVDRNDHLFLGSNGLTFTDVALDLPDLSAVTSFSVADVDGDGYLDVFFGQRCDSGFCGDRLLLNGKGRGFVDASARLSYPRSDSVSHSSGSQFVDIDRDGDPDLYLARRYPERGLVLFNDGAGAFSWSTASGQSLDFGPGSGGDWEDYDSDGDLDLLYPRLIHPYLRKYRDAHGSAIYARVDESPEGMKPVHGGIADAAIAYEERHSGGSWADIDNDGLLDAFMTTTGDCRFADLYRQEEDGTFALASFDYGLHWSNAGEDAVWVDYDNDGWLDLCTFDWNRLRLYRNPAKEATNGHVEVDAVLENGAHDVGALVTVHAGHLRITRAVSIGRGILIGEPPRLHFGLGDEPNVDSVVVVWSNGEREVFGGGEAKGLRQLVRGESGSTSAENTLTISAVPNPFSGRLYISYTVPVSGHVRLEIYSASGRLIKVLLDEEVTAGRHEAVWEAVDESGGRMANGTYIYKLRTDRTEVSGRSVLSR